MLGKEDATAGKKWKQAAMHELLTPCTKTSAESYLKGSQKPGSKERRQHPSFMKMAFLSILLFHSVSSSFTLMIEENMKFARQHHLQSYKVPHWPTFSGELLDNSYESTEKLVALILAVAKKYWETMDGVISVSCEATHQFNNLYTILTYT